ncbi:beta strand repeat-containing protein [Novipirellula sp. SH528]|uniref:beta strand repeat-containing protein n=1 Tax=Novipirellula sp. SH528 TaxID=3454466 RepID=UPI003FA07614
MNFDRRISAATWHAIDRLRRMTRRVRSGSERLDAGSANPMPIRQSRGYRPSLRPLEPRLVLNATAELSDLGQLLITGTSAADTVQLQVTADGSLQLRDEVNQIIPISNHPGNPTDPLAAGAVTAGQIIVSLGGGDDVFVAQLPSSLSVTVVDGDGSDTTQLILTDRGPIGTATHNIDSESITLNQDAPTISLSDDQLVLNGNVLIGTVNSDSVIDVGSGRLDVDGRVILLGSVDVVGNGGSVDLSNAITTSASDNVDLRFDLGTQPSTTFLFGDTDASGGRLIRNLEFVDASSGTLRESSIAISGDLNVSNQSSAIEIGEVVAARNIDLQTSSDVSLGLNAATLESLSIKATGDVTVSGTAAIENSFVINAGGGNVRLDSLSLTIPFAGDVVTIDNANDVTLGDIDGSQSRLSIGQNGDVRGDVTQAGGTRLVLNQVRVATDGLISLNSPGNDFDVIESINSDRDITIVETDNVLIVGDVRSFGGNIDIQNTAADFGVVFSGVVASSGGNIRVTSAQQIQMRDASVIDAGDGTISLSANSDITIASLVTTTASANAVRIDSIAGAIIDGGDSNLDIDANFGRVTLNSASGIGAADALDIRVSEIAAVVTASGSIQIAEDDSVRLLDLQTFDGEIIVTAADSIEIPDERGEDDNGEFQVDAKVIAGGTNGRIRLDAGNDPGDRLLIGNGVALFASQSTLGAVQLDANSVELGTQIEIRTGDNVGVARVFSPRPVMPPLVLTPDPNAPVGGPATEFPDPSDAAFYDTSSVFTNRLTQALGNGGAGFLTVGLGQSGEQGLTLNLDWGGDFERYQQVDLLAGGELHSIEHAYTEEDILESRLNGRTSATAPLEVRFSVRHHESIIVTGNSITQGSAEAEQVESGVISATDNDNPLRPDLNQAIQQNSVADNASLLHVNGQAQFIIPSLTIPVSFFPVRNVIPEPETFEIFVRVESTVELTSTNVLTSEASRGSAVVRDEYFQIRVISPDPDGEDLAPPKRLQDTILEGDNLKRLFAKLPDGRYVIEYVLGDGNERTIIQADVRNGEAIDLGDELDGGYLKLKMLDLMPEDTATPEQTESTQGDAENELDQQAPANGDDVSASDHRMDARPEDQDTVVKNPVRPTSGLANAADDRLSKVARFARLARSQS